MIRPLSKVKFFAALKRKPYAVKFLIDPNEDIIVECIKNSEATVSHFDPALLTTSLLEHLIRDFLSTTKNMYEHWVEAAKHWPLAAREAVNPELVHKLCLERSGMYHHFPNISYETMLALVSDNGSYNLDSIPERHRTREVLIQVYAKNPRQFDLADVLKFMDADFAEQVIEIQPTTVLELPKEFRTRKLLKRAFTKDSDIYLGNSTSTVPILSQLWDEELVAMAVTTRDNVKYIPKRLLTVELCLKALTADPQNLKYLPPELLNIDAIIHAYSNLDTWYRCFDLPESFHKDIDAIVLGVAEVAATTLKSAVGDQRKGMLREQPAGLYRLFCDLSELFTEDLWLRVLKIYPIALRILDKGKQTEAMVSTFVQTASPEIIDALADDISMMQIKKEQAMFLMGCKSEKIQELTERRLKPKTSKDASPIVAPVQDSVLLDVTDFQFQTIAGKEV